MNRNVGTPDRVIRVVLAAAALLGAVLIGLPSALGIVLLVVAAVLVGTAAVGSCPAYQLLGLSTCPVPARRA
jgi:hypothetical protein